MLMQQPTPELFTTDILTRNVGDILFEYIATIIGVDKNDAFLVNTNLRSNPIPLEKGGFLKLVIVPHDIALKIPDYVQKRSDFVQKLTVISKTIALGFQIIMHSCLTQEGAETYEQDPFLIKFDADTLTYLPTFIHPARFEFEPAKRYRQEILDLRDRLVDEGKWDEEPESSKVYMNLEYNKYDSIVRRFEQNEKQIIETERIKNQDFALCLRIGLVYVHDK